MGGCLNSETRPTSLHTLLALVPWEGNHTCPGLTYRSFWHFSFSTTQGRWPSPPRGATAPALQRSLERWFCKTGTRTDLSFAAAGTWYLFTFIEKLATLETVTHKKREVMATRPNFDPSKEATWHQARPPRVSQVKVHTSASLLLAWRICNDKAIPQSTHPTG